MHGAEGLILTWFTNYIYYIRNLKKFNNFVSKTKKNEWWSQINENTDETVVRRSKQNGLADRKSIIKERKKT